MLRITERAYLAIFLAAAIAACCVTYMTIWVSRINECRVSGAPNAYLAYCSQRKFGDYEHGAFYFDLEAGVLAGLKKADVLFVGSSQAQVGFSTEAVRNFFDQRNVSYYLLGFGYNEGSAFEADLIERFHLRPKVIVIATDYFPSFGLSAPAKAVTTGNVGTYIEYESKHWAALLSPTVCNAISWACSRNLPSVYRSAIDGHWIWKTILAPPDAAIPIDPNKRKEPTVSFDTVAAARDFIRRARVENRCVVITATQDGWVDWEPLAREIGRRLDLLVVLPELDGLATFDRSHLNEASAERWSAAVLGKIGPVLDRCIGRAAD